MDLQIRKSPKVSVKNTVNASSNKAIKIKKLQLRRLVILVLNVKDRFTGLIPIIDNILSFIFITNALW